MQHRERAHPRHRPDQATPHQHAENLVHPLVVKVAGVGRRGAVVTEAQRGAPPWVLLGDPLAREVGDDGARPVARGVQSGGGATGDAQV